MRGGVQMSKNINLDLATAASGAIQERFEQSLAKVMANIMDVNTEPEKKRQITLTIDLIPSPGRTEVGIEVTAKEKLVPRYPAKTRMLIERDYDSGMIYADELISGVKGQTMMDFDKGTVVTDTGKDVDEIEEEQRVIDFRKNS